MDRYKKHQLIASICVTLFIMSFSLCLLVMNRSVFKKCAVDKETITSAEAILNYEQLADDFETFFSKKYNVSGYEILNENVNKLNELKVYYRWAWVISVICVIVAIYSFTIISKRRDFTPFLYGGIFAAFLTSINAFVLIKSDKPIFEALRNMIFREDYSYFSEGDILLQIMPPDYAKWLALTYIFIVIILILTMIFIRAFIIFCGRPHKF